MSISNTEADEENHTNIISVVTSVLLIDMQACIAERCAKIVTCVRNLQRVADI